MCVACRTLNRQARESGIAHDVFAERSASPSAGKSTRSRSLSRTGPMGLAGDRPPQRARLFDAVLSDAYGAQTLLQSGKDPAAARVQRSFVSYASRGLYGPGRPSALLCGRSGARARRLWRVLDNHAETMAGLGFALANRVPTVTSWAARSGAAAASGWRPSCRSSRPTCWGAPDAMIHRGAAYPGPRVTHEPYGDYYSVTPIWLATWVSCWWKAAT